MSHKEIVKITVGALIILLLLRIIFSTQLLGEVPLYMFILFGLIVASIAVFMFIRNYPLIRVTISGKSESEYMKDVIRECLKNGIPINAKISGGDIIRMPKVGVSAAIGENMEDYYLGFEDCDGVSRNIFYDGTKKKIRAQIWGDPLNARPKEATKEAAELMQTLKLGKAPKLIPTPGLIREIQTVIEKGKPEEKQPLK